MIDFTPDCTHGESIDGRHSWDDDEYPIIRCFWCKRIQVSPTKSDGGQDG